MGLLLDKNCAMKCSCLSLVMNYILDILTELIWIFWPKTDSCLSKELVLCTLDPLTLLEFR